MYPNQSPQFINTFANPPFEPEFELQHPTSALSFVYASTDALDSGRSAQLAHPGHTSQLQEQQNVWAQQRSYGWDPRQWGPSAPIYYEGSLDTQDIGLRQGDGQSSYQQGVPSGVSLFQVYRFRVEVFVLLQTYLRRAHLQLFIRAR